MNRFESETYTATDRNHDEYVAHSHCDICRDSMPLADLYLVPDGTPQPLFLCETCKRDREEQQEECTCVCSGDQADATYCDLHNPPARKGPQRVAQTRCALGLCHNGAHLWVSVKSLPQPGECPATPRIAQEVA